MAHSGYRTAPLRRAVALVAMVATAAACGAAAVAHIVARIHPLLVVLPVLQGLAVGITVRAAITRFRLGAPVRAAIISGGSGVAAALGHAAIDARVSTTQQRSRCDALQALRGSMGVSSMSEINDEHTTCVAQSTYLRALDARFGATHTISRVSGWQSPYVGRGITALELALAGCVASVLAARRAARSHCDICGAWRQPRALGDIRSDQAEPLATAIRSGDLHAVTQATLAADTRNATQLILFTCPHNHDRGGGSLQLDNLVVDRHGRSRVQHTHHIAIAPAAVHAIRAALVDDDEQGPSHE